MVPYDEPIYGFSSEQVSTRGYIDLHTVFRDGTQTKTIPIRILIIDAPTSYNVLLGHPLLNTLGEDLDPRVGQDVRLEAVEETSPLELPNGHSINLGTNLNSDERAIITPILVSNTNIFAWSAADLPGVDPLVASHKLSIYKEARYISQKKYKLGEERRLAAKDYTDLNKAYPRDAYRLANIDRLVDGATGNKVLSFLDAYFGYNQIPMAASDMNKTAFITDNANYFYRVMPFRLKNARATYQ
ncbi:uncharacterized protein LOC114173580 [Vigna unguiculata]|uniref:uncharacterized protein LOC114173580 n=1 Tax=Vigna unguiculata TaxID=3917 RepID=UPI00101691AD|nr:uncharacterized protein LOC114173580 [Vigna unguiculata]